MASMYTMGYMLLNGRFCHASISDSSLVVIAGFLYICRRLDIVHLSELSDDVPLFLAHPIVPFSAHVSTFCDGFFYHSPSAFYR